MGSCRKLAVLGVVALIVAGCSSSSDEDPPSGSNPPTGSQPPPNGSQPPPTGSPPPQLVPADQTEAAYEAFLNEGLYTQNGWVSDVPTPREATSTVSPHDRVRVWFSPKAVESFAAGNGLTSDAPGHFVDTMVVKDMYDGDTLIGRASFWKVEEGTGPTAWIYYCKAPAGRCYFESPAFDVTPLFKKAEPQCGSCHGGFVFTKPTP